MKNGHVAGVEFLSATDHSAITAEAQKLFETLGKQRGAEALEIWEGARFITRYPEQPAQSETKM